MARRRCGTWGDRIDRERGELGVKAGEHDAGAAGGEGVDVLGFAWWRPGRRCWPSSPRQAARAWTGGGLAGEVTWALA
jgi:hypothetical protein